MKLANGVKIKNARIEQFKAHAKSFISPSEIGLTTTPTDTDFLDIRIPLNSNTPIAPGQSIAVTFTNTGTETWRPFETVIRVQRVV